MVAELSREPPKLQPAQELLFPSGKAPKLCGPKLGSFGKAGGLVGDCRPTLAGPVLGVALAWKVFSTFDGWFQLGCGGFGGAGFGAASASVRARFFKTWRASATVMSPVDDMAPRCLKKTSTYKVVMRNATAATRCHSDTMMCDATETEANTKPVISGVPNQNF